jgi:hypothetical protein
MKKIFMVSIFLSFALISHGQEKNNNVNTTKKQQEAGILFNDFNNFGITYKFGNNKSLWRLRTLSFTGDNSELDDKNENEDYKNYGFTFAFGKEFRKIISKNFELRYGADLKFTFDYSEKTEYDKPLSEVDYYAENRLYKPGVNLVIGFNYLIKPQLSLGAEMLPQFSYSTGTTERKYSAASPLTERESSGFSYGFSSNAVLISISYRF